LFLSIEILNGHLAVVSGINMKFKYNYQGKN
jgi:hypothetical protein